MTNFEPEDMEKRDLRHNIRRRIASLTEEQRSAASRNIFEQVASLPEFIEAEVVALYASLPDEPCTAHFIAEWHGSKRIVLPRIEGEQMHFHDYSPEDLRSGAFGIQEPQESPRCRPEEIDFMVVPGVAFTRDGWRMGRGKGFYDRYLSQVGFRAHTVGVCFREQLAESLPTEPHDMRVERLITNNS